MDSASGSGTGSVKVGLVQMSMGTERSENLDVALSGAREAASGGAEVICLPELFTSRYFCQVQDPAFFDWAEPIPGPTTHEVSQLARELGVTIVTPLFERRAAGLYHNSLVVVGPDGALGGHYRKLHIPDDPHFQEKFYFTPGDLGVLVAQTPAARLGALICWDQWYPEAARLAALRGAELLFYPTAIGWLPEEKQSEGPSQLDAWRTVQRGHAIANGVFVIAVNRVGRESMGPSEIQFWGHSFVCDPFGVVLAEAGEEEAVLVVECQLGRQEEVRRTWPFLRDRRVDAYGGLDARFLESD
jgi:N-carbamoylputrescine amidase